MFCTGGSGGSPEGISPGGGLPRRATRPEADSRPEADIQQQMCNLRQWIRTKRRNSPPRGRGVASEGDKLLLGARAPFLTGPERIPDRMSFMAIV